MNIDDLTVKDAIASAYRPLLERLRDATKYLLSLDAENETDIQLLADLDAELAPILEPGEKEVK